MAVLFGQFLQELAVDIRIVQTQAFLILLARKETFNLRLFIVLKLKLALIVLVAAIE